MKLKILSAVLALVMLVSLLPTTAVAADCDHDYDYVSHGNNTHSQICSKCKDVKSGPSACSSSILVLYAYCTTCWGEMCKHNVENHTPNNNGTHTSACACGKTSSTGNCTFGDDDLCTVCKGTNPCDHTLNDANPNGDCTHTGTCDCGKVSATGKCTFGENDVCTVCNGLNPCSHTPKAPTSNGDGTHTSTCDCGRVSDTDDCTFGEDGTCTICNGACDHNDTRLENNNHWNHNIVCNICEGFVSTENHRYDFFSHLCDCGAADPLYQWVCQHKDHHPVNAGINHKLVCTECHIVCFYEPHGYNAEGICSCGATAPECQHEHTTIVNNGADHSTVCDKCGHPFSTVEHTYDVFGMCTCGAVKSNEVEDKDEEPAPSYPADAWNRLDELFVTFK